MQDVYCGQCCTVQVHTLLQSQQAQTVTQAPPLFSLSLQQQPYSFSSIPPHVVSSSSLVFFSSSSSQWFSLSVTKGPSTLKIPDGAYASNTTQHAYPSLPPSLPLSPLISNTLSLLSGLPVVWRSPPLIQFELNVEVKDASKCPAFPLLACLVACHFFHFLFHFPFFLQPACFPGLI